MDEVSRATTTPIGATPARAKNAMSVVPIAPRSSCLGSGDQQTMLNFAVRDLDAMLAIGEPGKAHQGCVFTRLQVRL
jgi:hypothetical protein